MNHDAMRLADKFATLTAGWMFDAVTLDQFYKSAYQSGWKAGSAARAALAGAPVSVLLQRVRELGEYLRIVDDAMSTRVKLSDSWQMGVYIRQRDWWRSACLLMIEVDTASRRGFYGCGPKDFKAYHELRDLIDRAKGVV